VDALLVIAPDLINYRPVEVMSTIPTILVNCLDRLAGIEAAAEHTSVSVQAVANRDIGSGFDAARTLLSAPGAPTALICTHERMAVGARLLRLTLGSPFRPICRWSALTTASCWHQASFRR